MDEWILKGAMIIDGTGRPPIENGSVRIRGERIVAVGQETGDPAGARVLNFPDQVLLPGLIDCHNHVSMDPTQENWPAHLSDSDVEQTLRAVNNLAADLKSGVTTARCLGDRNFLDVACKKAIESGRLPGPRLVVATRGIRATHGHGMVGYPFDGPDSVRRAVRENVKAGADVIKLFITGTVRTGPDLPCFPSAEEISTAVEEAHRAGLPAAAHCIGGAGFEHCLSAGLDCFEHGYFFTDRQIELLLKSGRWLDLTPSPFFTEERIRTLPGEIADAFRQNREEVAERMRSLVGSGVKFAAGTDGMHGELAREAEYLVDFGAAPEQALAAVTRNAAALIGLEKSVGTLEPGKAADIIGVTGNPLQDIRALRSVRTVFSRGRFFLQS
jgi:imidazolonepropionase-like amidohydrolase